MKQNNEFEIKRTTVRELTTVEKEQVAGGITTPCLPPDTEITTTIATTTTTPQCGTNLTQYL
ncbi:MAG TPA: hypothetical protein ENJ41_08130 [Oceanospirillales bacterium]|nr:hypothetical protein [Oceanospirillales bacterium]